jgi:VWFA-related protein
VAVCILAITVCSPLKAQTPSESVEVPSFRSGVNLVLIDASITNNENVPVGGLAKNAFSIRENGMDKDLAIFESGSTNISMALVVDNSGSMRNRWASVMQSVVYLRSTLQPHDEAELSIFNDAPLQLQGRRKAENFSASNWLALLDRHQPTGRTTLYDAILEARASLSESAYDRRVLIVVSDGADTHSRATLNEVLNELKSSNVLVYCVGLFEAGEEGTNAPALRKLAESTGGIALIDPDEKNLSRDFASIMTDLRSRYLLGYRSSDAAVGVVEVRKIQVSAVGPNGKHLRVRARPEYRVGTEAAAPLKKSK